MVLPRAGRNVDYSHKQQRLRYIDGEAVREVERQRGFLTCDDSGTIRYRGDQPSGNHGSRIGIDEARVRHAPASLTGRLM
jgi:hypothetical protein